MNKGMKKRASALFLSLCIAIPVLSAQPAAVSAEDTTLRGDLNEDGVLTVDDVFWMQQYLLMTGGSFHSSCDFNADGQFNAKDLSLLKRYLMYKEPDPETENAVLMVYMCGSDLETEAAEGIEDLYEMVKADYSAENLTVVVMTGGAKDWHDPSITADQNYYVVIDHEGAYSDPVDGTQRYMSDPNTLEFFIRDTVQNYPAKHYALVMWDHGSGPIYGLCYDELSNSMLYLPGMCSALKNAGVHFDWIGFDCCLMGNTETAYAIRNYADYMIGSEESESGFGWRYDNFLSKWSAQPDMEVPQLAKIIIDDMTNVNRASWAESTLACYDLSKMDDLMQSYCAYINDVYQLCQSRGIYYIQDARGRCLDFGEGEFDLVDLGSLVQNLNADHTNDVLTAIQQTVIYNRSNRIQNPCGISVWFFENYPEDGYYLLQEMFKGLGFSDDYLRQMRAMSKTALEIKTGHSVREVHLRTTEEILEVLRRFRQPVV